MTRISLASAALAPIAPVEARKPAQALEVCVNGAAEGCLNLMFLSFNVTRPPLGNPLVRQALGMGMGIDRMVLRQTLYGGEQAYTANGILPPTAVGSDPALKIPDHDPEAARALLKKASVAPGQSRTLAVFPIRGALESAQMCTQQAPGLNLNFLACNLKRPPFDRLEVRQGLDMAIDWTRIREQLYQGTASIDHNSIIPRSLAGFDPAMANAPCDRDKARAGGISGLKLTLLLPTVSTLNPNSARLGALITESWVRIGVEVKVVTPDFDRYMERARNGDFDVVHVDWFANYPGPDSVLGTLLTCEAVGGPFDTAIEAAHSEQLPCARAGPYRNAQHLFRADLVWSPLFHADDSVVMHKRVTRLLKYLCPLTFLRYEKPQAR